MVFGFLIWIIIVMDTVKRFYEKALSDIENGISVNELYQALYKYEKLEDYNACAGILKAIIKKTNNQ